jgi:NAD-dependent deacetylase
VTGPGLSRESGFAPFDPADMPLDTALEDVVTREGFERDPALTYAFYNLRRRQLLERVSPNPAHEALAVLDTVMKGDLLIVTRNIDDLHERAGNEAVIHTHGNLLKARCMICTKISDRFDDLTGREDCPICGNYGHLRPHIVWVGEEPLGMDTVYAALATCRLFLAIGTAAHVEPTAGFLAGAKRVGARTIEFTAEPTPASGEFDECRHGAQVETVPAWVKKMIAGWPDLPLSP